MALEDDIGALAHEAAQLKTSGRFGHNPAEADIHRQLELIWDALRIVARKVDETA